MQSVKYIMLAGPKPEWVSDEVHTEAQGYADRIVEIYSDSVKNREWYATVSPEVYDETMRIVNFNDPYHLIDQMIESEKQGGLGLSRDIKICDIGCGSGIIGRHLAKNGFKDIFGTDGSDEMLVKANRDGAYRETRQMYIGDEPLSEELKNAFDVVVASGVWGHNHIPARCVKEVMHLVKIGGLLVTGMREMYWHNGEEFGLKDAFD